MAECAACKFYTQGQCRLHPPVRLPRAFRDDASAGNRVRDETLLWGWPEVKPGHWCGDFKHFIRPWWRFW